jgi:hypothetical protein
MGVGRGMYHDFVPDLERSALDWRYRERRWFTEEYFGTGSVFCNKIQRGGNVAQAVSAT